MEMVQVIEGVITQYRLPKVGQLKDGSTVSGYNLLSETTLENEGWLELVKEELPLYIEETEYLMPQYEIMEDKVILKHTIKKIKINPITLALQKLVKLEDLTEEEIKIMMEIYRPYEVGAQYAVGDIFKFEDALYEVIQEHTSQEEWVPSDTPSLYKNWLPNDVIGEWVKPTGAHDAYNIGDKVTFQGGTYESIIDSNVWSPLEYPSGWESIAI